MIKEIKEMPWGVMVAIVFLLSLYVTLFAMAPMFWLCFSLAVGAYFAVLRLAHYFRYGE